MEDVAVLTHLKVQRIANFEYIEGKPRRWELHVFCDASIATYGTVSYIREKRDGLSPILQLTSKARVAPVSKTNLSLARTELLAMLLGSRLAVKIIAAVDHIEWTVYLWSDSMIGICWVQGNAEQWKPFVRNRVEITQKRFPPNRWLHCPGIENSADLAPRGAKATKLVESTLWWSGPHWLCKAKTE